jgi:hypothetical protein
MIDVVDSCSGDWWARRFADFKKLLHRLKLEDGRRWSTGPISGVTMLKQCWLRPGLCLGGRQDPA